MKYLPQIVRTLQVTQPGLDLDVLTSHGVDVVLVDCAQSGVLCYLAVSPLEDVVAGCRNHILAILRIWGAHLDRPDFDFALFSRNFIG